MTHIHITAEQVKSPHSPLLTAYEAGRWYALHDQQLPAGATLECRRGYFEQLQRRP